LAAPILIVSVSVALYPTGFPPLAEITLFSIVIFVPGVKVSCLAAKPDVKASVVANPLKSGLFVKSSKLPLKSDLASHSAISCVVILAAGEAENTGSDSVTLPPVAEMTLFVISIPVPAVYVGPAAPSLPLLIFAVVVPEVSVIVIVAPVLV
jgi:hypothetical protein